MAEVKYDVSEVPAEARPANAPMTRPQENYLRDLIKTRQMSDEDRKEALRRMTVEGLTKKEASRWIERAKTLPRASSNYARRLESFPSVPEGRYAVMIDDTLKFFRVRIGKENNNRWAGFMFIDAGRGGNHGDLQWTAVKNVAYKKQILDQIIEADPKTAGERFGREVGACYVCGRSLTDETSRALGIGPDCRSNRGGY